AALCAAIAFLYSPYILFNALPRANLAEQWALAFAPFALWRFLELTRNQTARNWMLAVVTFAAVLLSHNVTGFLFAPLLLLFTLVCVFSTFRFSFSAFRFSFSAFRFPHSAFRFPHSAFRFPHSAFRIPLFIFRIPLSAFRVFACPRAVGILLAARARGTRLCANRARDCDARFRLSFQFRFTFRIVRARAARGHGTLESDISEHTRIRANCFGTRGRFGRRHQISHAPRAAAFLSCSCRVGTDAVDAFHFQTGVGRHHAVVVCAIADAR